MFKWLSEHKGSYRLHSNTLVHINPELDRVKITVESDHKTVYCCTTQFIHKVPFNQGQGEEGDYARGSVERLILYIQDEGDLID